MYGIVGRSERIVGGNKVSRQGQQGMSVKIL